MRYDVKLQIEYEYQGTSDHARNLLHLLPAEIPDRQRISASLLTVDPVPQERRDLFDFYGNLVTFIAFHEPVDRISLSLVARAERLLQPPGLEFSPALSALPREIAEVRRIDGTAPHHFLGPSPRVSPNADMTAFARGLVTPDMPVLEAVRGIGEALHREMTFDPEATEVDTPATEAFAARHGVCQDFSHIMIACLRSLGIPAGYVSGFLRTIPPEGEERLEGADAMHAWVRAWCGAEAGWLEFDPTNNISAGMDHITVAVGRDYGDVAPVKGVIRTAGEQETSHCVDVIPLPA
ncbi:transglutaminase family protein [Vannielia litorea]|uniref:Transglutaminase-like enzyme, putative cysteine protease n=1 Tax=Vannielia litorea TaxID=1217970 RepID=A0A1N6HLQ7_9RHOB|nr:transglutaminase family protein [Vannielia litorea]SIO20666.1 Transglutaminase-like enzyme, putative cysteine protease [Vannielia litorea]